MNTMRKVIQIDEIDEKLIDVNQLAIVKYDGKDAIIAGYKEQIINSWNGDFCIEEGVKLCNLVGNVAHSKGNQLYWYSNVKIEVEPTYTGEGDTIIGELEIVRIIDLDVYLKTKI